MRNSKSKLHSDDWIDAAIVIALFIYGGTFVWFMYNVWAVDYATIANRVCGLIFGALVYINSAGLITMGIVCINMIIQRIKETGYTWKQGVLFVAVVVLFGLGQMIFQFVYWGVVLHKNEYFFQIIPIIILCAISIIYVWKYLDEEV